MKKQREYSLWMFGLLLGCLAVLIMLSDACTHFSVLSLAYDCQLRKHSGILCPGCGMTRAMLFFLRGKFVRSFFFHPVVPYAGILYLVFMFRGLIHFLTKGRFSFMKFRVGYVYAAIAVILIQFVVKNIFLLGYGVVWI